MAPFVDHYAALGIEPTANANEIKKAYRCLALKHHPDKTAPGSEPDSSRFVSALAAYEILIDDSKRKAYDVQYKDISIGTAPYQATRATQSQQRQTSGGFSGDFWSYPAPDDEDLNMPGAYPSDDDSNQPEPGYQYEDTYAYEGPFAGRRYPSCSAGGFGFDTSGLYTQGFDATDSRHQFPDDFADDASPAQGYGNESRWEGERHHDDENTAPGIADPISEAFDILSDISESQNLGEKVKGRYYENALHELRLQKGRCKEIDTQLEHMDARLRRRVSQTAGGIPLQDLDKWHKPRMRAARRLVRVRQLQIEQAIFIMRHEQKPGSWKATDKRTRGIINTIEKSAGDLSQMRQGLPGLDSIVVKMEGLKNSDLGQLKGCVTSFGLALRDWSDEVSLRSWGLS